MRTKPNMDGPWCFIKFRQAKAKAVFYVFYFFYLKCIYIFF
uniref:Uncharacterized protein n=1 Tax=Lepeophtheirus salmonis TaxID=72036 RepID=A0A0K2VA61_LEPSM